MMQFSMLVCNLDCKAYMERGAEIGICLISMYFGIYNNPKVIQAKCNFFPPTTLLNKLETSIEFEFC